MDPDRAWRLLLELASYAKQGKALVAPTGFVWDGQHGFERAELAQADIIIDVRDGNAECCGSLSPEARRLFEIYLPLCVGAGANELVIAHVGQSLDGYVATRGGASAGLTGAENVRHMHRLRALCHAVVVGARTVECDDPRLTTRLVRGEHPTRVILDPDARLPPSRQVFVDGEAPTLWVCATAPEPPSGVKVLHMTADNHRMRTRALIARLAECGLRRVFIEGGGITVSHFLEDEALDLLHVAVCPTLLGAGRPGLILPGVCRVAQARHPPSRHFSMGPDVVFECRFDRSGPPPTSWPDL